MSDLLKTSFDEFSDCGGFRYVMGHTWGSGPKLASVALNPSVGNKDRNDPTNERLERRAISMGLDGVVFLNLFPIVATDPRDMKKAANPYGNRQGANDVILEYCAGNFVLCGWGVHGSHRGRDVEVRSLLEDAGHTLHALGLTKTGQPKHPLYISYETQPFKWAASR